MLSTEVYKLVKSDCTSSREQTSWQASQHVQYRVEQKNREMYGRTSLVSARMSAVYGGLAGDNPPYTAYTRADTAYTRADTPYTRADS